MKKKTLFTGIVIMTIIIFSTCSKDDLTDQDSTDNDTITATTTLDSGTIGLLIDTRLIAHKGYFPSVAELEFSSDYETFSTKLDIDPNTQIAYFRLSPDSLEKETVDDLKNGVPLTILIYSAEDVNLAQSSSSRQIIDASNIPVYLETEMPKINPAFALNPSASFIIQSGLDGNVWTTYEYDAGPGNGHLYTEPFDPDGIKHQKFYFKNVPGEGDSVFYILSDRGYVHSINSLNLYRETATPYDGGTLTDGHKVVLKVDPDNEGWLLIRPKNGTYLGKTSEDWEFSEKGLGNHLSFRLFNGEIDWILTSQGTTFHQPLLPPAQLEFAYSATLYNCSSATLSESVGKNDSRSQTFTNSFEESLELFTSKEKSIEVKAGVEVEAKFFGKGAKYNLEVTGGLKYTTSSTTTTTNKWEESTTTEVEVSRVRDLELQPHSAVEVYDAIQVLYDVSVPFTKHFRLKAKDKTGVFLKGDEINFQLFANNFGGIITETGEDYIDFTIRGSSKVDKMLEVETRVKELEGECD